jgi:hypothetical protein
MLNEWILNRFCWKVKSAAEFQQEVMNRRLKTTSRPGKQIIKRVWVRNTGLLFRTKNNWRISHITIWKRGSSVQKYCMCVHVWSKSRFVFTSDIVTYVQSIWLTYVIYQVFQKTNVILKITLLSNSSLKIVSETRECSIFWSFTFDYFEEEDLKVPLSWSRYCTYVNYFLYGRKGFFMWILKSVGLVTL